MKAGCQIARWHLQEAKRFLSSVESAEQFRPAARISPRIAAYCRKRRDKGMERWNTLMLREVQRRYCSVRGATDQKTLKPILSELLTPATCCVGVGPGERGAVGGRQSAYSGGDGMTGDEYHGWTARWRTADSWTPAALIVSV
ncbi:MAG: hypothetical protein R3E95_02455 [Thiolinea sp.]